MEEVITIVGGMNMSGDVDMTAGIEMIAMTVEMAASTISRRLAMRIRIMMEIIP